MASFFQQKILKWYAAHRRDLPWRHTKNPYNIWLSEIMLQQTRVEQGLPYYMAFVKHFPDIHALADAEDDVVFKLWEGLGYYSRARNLLKTARIVSREYGGQFPSEYNGLISLPGIGPYTAAAIASICFDERRAVVDGNVVRLLSRVFGVQESFKQSSGKKAFQELAQSLITSKHPGDFNQAMMEFGARHCVPKNPQCSTCTFGDQCWALAHQAVDRLPTKEKTKAKKRRYFHYLLFVQGDHVLLRKRPNQGIWSNLYEFPYIEQEQALTPADIRDVCKGWGIDYRGRLQKLDIELQQTLSHQVINGFFYTVDGKWVVSDENAPFLLPKIENLSTFAFPRLLNWFFERYTLT